MYNIFYYRTIIEAEEKRMKNTDMKNRSEFDFHRNSSEEDGTVNYCSK